MPDESKRARLQHGFGPFYRPDSQLLILGSFPSVKSREASFFYGHPQNRFWRVTAALCGEETPVSRAEKESFLARHRIAMYDVIESCTIIGSADSTIRDVEPADLRPILAAAPGIGGHIFVNGAKAHALYHKYIEPKLGIPAVRLSSSSPANAAVSAERLIQLWGEALGDLLR